MRKILFIAPAAVVAAVVLTMGAAQAGDLIMSKDIKDGTIKVRDLRPGAVKKLHGQTGATGETGAKGAEGAKGETGAQGEQGPAGAEGPQGPQGPAGADGHDGADSTVEGPQGPAGPAGADGADASLDTYIVQNEFHVATGAGQKSEGTAACHPGDLVLSGGYSSNDHNNHWTRIYQNRMTWVNTGNESTPDGWYVQALGSDDGNATNADILVWAFCTTV